MKSPFPSTSRYHDVDTATWEAVPGGPKVVYLKRRFLPRAKRFAVLQEHTVEGGDRLDNLAAKYLGDAEQYWRLCDPNSAMHPDELVAVVGRRLRITLPEGLPGGPGAG